MSNLLNKAYEFAKEKHDATHKLYNGEPFIIHPELVVTLLEVIAPLDEELLAAGYCHDLIEDCNVSYEELVEKFGAGVANLVREVTKDENNDFPNLSTIRGLVLKAADNFANCSNLEGLEDKEKQIKLFTKYGTMYKHAGSNLKRWTNAVREEVNKSG